MNIVKFNSVKKSLFFLVSISIILITFFFSLFLIQSISTFFESQKKTIKENTQVAADAYIHGINLMLLMKEKESLDQEKVSNISNSLIEEYNKRKDWDFLLDKFSKHSPHIDISIINKNNIIIYSTNKKYIDVDLSAYPPISQSLNEIRTDDKKNINGISSSVITGTLTNFTYKATEDKKYVIQIAINLHKYINKLQQKITLNNVVKKLEDNKHIERLEYYDSFGLKCTFFNNHITCSKNISKEDTPYFIQALNSDKTISINKKIKGKTLTEEFIPYKILKEDGEIKGIIKITYDFSYYNVLTKRYIIMITLLAALCIFIFIHIIRKNTDALMAPIDKLLDGMNQVAVGQYDTSIDIKTNNEFETLGDNFNNMVKEIAINKQTVIKQRDEITTLYNQQIATSQQLEEVLDANKQNYFETIKALAKAIDAKDPYTNGHCHRVMEYSVAIAKEMGYLDCQLEELRYGALLHDIGKIGIPEDILNKKGKLTEEEFNIIKSHPSIGYGIIKDIDFLSIAKKIVYEHHERIDGKGYPNSLEGNEISIFSRIVCAADSYDAMTSNRAYRKSMSVEKAVAELEKGRGTQFDSEVVDVFIKLIKNGQINNM